MFGFDPDSWAQAFAGYLAVHAGFDSRPESLPRWRPGCSLTAGIVLGARHGQSDVPAFWCAGAIFLAVAFGMLRRSRHRLLATADELVIQSRKAAAAVEVGTELSRDLHDVLAHSLSGVTMQLSMADALFEAGRIEQGRTALKQVQRLVVDGLGEARRAVSVLRSGAFDVAIALQAVAISSTSATMAPVGSRLRMRLRVHQRRRIGRGAVRVWSGCARVPPDWAGP